MLKKGKKGSRSLAIREIKNENYFEILSYHTQNGLSSQEQATERTNANNVREAVGKEQPL